LLKLKNLRNKNIHIVGLSGTEGAQIAKFLQAKKCKNVTAHDFCEEKDFRENFLMFHGALDIEDRKKYFKEINDLPIKKCFKKNYLEDIEKADLIFVSQGWYLYPFNKPKLFNAQKSGIPFYTILNVYLSICKAKTIGITGSNGKTTTSRLIYETLKLKSQSSKLKALYVGNDRGAIQDLFGVEKLKKDDFLVLEISNRQLKFLKDVSPNVAVIINITENHLNEHESFEEYAETKFKIFKFQKKGDYAIINFDDKMSRQCLDNSPHPSLKREGVSNLVRFSVKEKTDVFIKNKKIFIAKKIPASAGMTEEEIEILDLNNIKIPGKHNVENVLAAVSATYFAGVKPEIIKKAISNFKGVEKRLEFMDEIKGVRYYNDLSSTTPVSTIAGINAFKGAKYLTLILGGDHKNVSYNELMKVLIDKVDMVILMPGTILEKLKMKNLSLTMIGGEKLKIKTKFFKVQTALEAFQIASKKTKAGGVVLLSPAGEGFFSKFLNRRTGGLSLKKILSKISNLKHLQSRVGRTKI